MAVETFDSNLPTRCASCGGLCDVRETVLSGAKVKLQQTADNQALQRLDVIAIAAPSGPPQVKRIWGLPEEQIEFRDGEIYIDGQLFQKSLRQFRQICVPVSSFPADRRSHWMMHQGDSLVPIESLATSDGASSLLTIAAEQPLSWQYRRPARVHPKEIPPHEWLEPASIVDDYRENQGVHCQLHAVDDYLLSVRLPSPLAGDLQITCCYRGLLLPVALRTRDAKADGALSATCSSKIDIAFCDGRIFLATDTESRVIDFQSLDPQRLTMRGDVREPNAGNEIIRLTSPAGFRVEQLVVARDLYLTAAPTVQSTELGTASAGYFVLGDNLPVSIDSRGALGRVARHQILGKIYNFAGD